MRNRAKSERGASVVEFAFIAPMALFILFGIIEFGYLFGQKLDVANGTREAARLAAVNYSPAGTTGATQTTDMVGEICDRMEVANGTAISIGFTTGDDRGDKARVRVQTTAKLVTGVFDPWFAGSQIVNEVDFRLEQDATYAATAGQGCP